MDKQLAAWEAFDEAERAEIMDALMASGGALAEAGEEGFVPDTPEKAAWLTSRIAFHEAEAARIKEAMQAEINRHARAAEFLSGRHRESLEALARQLIAADGGKRQKAVLPNGISLAFRKLPDGLQVEDESAALAWAKANCPDAVVIKESLSKTTLKSWYLETGEVAEGCSPLRDRVGFYIQGGKA